MYRVSEILKITVVLEHVKRALGTLDSSLIPVSVLLL